MYIRNMDLHLSNWGNSLGLRIPKVLAKALRLQHGSTVHAEVEDGKLVISPASPLEKLKAWSQDFDLEEMMARVTEENRPDSKEEEPAGREIW